MNHLYVSDFPFKNFCKLAKQAETMKNYQKHSFGYDWVLSWETHKLTRFQSWEFSYISFICKSEKCLRVQPARADIIHSQRRIVCTKKVVYSYGLENRGISLGNSQTFDHATWQHPHENPTLVRGSARIYVIMVSQFVPKNGKIVPCHRCAGIPWLTVSVPD